MTNNIGFNDKGRGARKGSDVIHRLEEHPPNIWCRGRRLKSVFEVESFKNSVNTLASLYDYQWERSEVMLMDVGGKKVNRSFSIPKDKSNLNSL